MTIKGLKKDQLPNGKTCALSLLTGCKKTEEEHLKID